MRILKGSTFTVHSLLMVSLALAPWPVQGATTAPPELADAKAAAAKATAAAAQKQEDRKDGSGAAIAMAAVGAGIAALSCLELYKQAQELEATNPAQAAQLRAMAAQQCAQAAQDAGNAAQNQKGKDTLAATDSAPQENQAATDSPTSNTPPTAQNTPDPTQQVADADTQTDPSPSVFDSPADPGTPSELTLVGAAPNGTSSLNPIQPNQLGFDDSAKTSDSSTNAASMMGSLFGGSGSSPSSQNGSLGSLASVGADSGHATTKGRRKTSSEGSSDSSSASNDSTSSGGGSDMGSVLSRLMGGGKDDEELVSNGPGGGLAAGTPGSGKSPNIFQYASYRVKKARNEGNLKRVGTVANAAPRSISSVQE